MEAQSINQTRSHDTKSSNVSRNIITESPPDPGVDVFIDVGSSVEKLRTLLSKPGSYITFIRAPVASGKTTLAKFLIKYQHDEFVFAKFRNSAEEWYREFVRASGTSVPIGHFCTQTDAAMALIEIGKQRKTIVIDEAHTLFAFKDVVTLITKGMEMQETRPKILLFSASGSAISNEGKTIVTPTSIKNKFVWYPPPPNSEDFSKQLEDAGVRLTPKAVDFFVKLCGGNRGILMHAMEWVYDCQNDHNQSPSEGEKITWDDIESANQVRKSFTDSSREKMKGYHGWSVGLKSHLVQCRAVRVSGGYSDPSNIPQEFGSVLFGGAKMAYELNGLERELTVAGFLFPQKKTSDNSEFFMYDWTDDEAKYSVPNPIMASYYSDILPRYGTNRKFTGEMWTPNNGLDFLARAIPYLTFESVVDPPRLNEDGGLQDNLAKSGLPYEDNYNTALASIFNQFGFKVSTPLSCGQGKPGIVITYDDNKKTCVIESIMTTQTLVSRLSPSILTV